MNFYNKVMELKNTDFLNYIDFRETNEYLFMKIRDFIYFSFDDKNWVVKRLYKEGDNQEGETLREADKKRKKFYNKAKELEKYL